jgi:hypothetical protein
MPPQEEDTRAGDGRTTGGGRTTGHYGTIGLAAGTVMILATLALVAFLAVVLQPAAPVEIAEVIAATGGLLAAVTAAVRAIRGK